MSQQQPIAVVGASALFPGSSDATGFWNDICAGRDRIGDVPPTHWLVEDFYDPDPSAPDKTYARRGGFLRPVDFDAGHWGIPPNMLGSTDTSQLLALIVAEQVLRDAARTRFETIDRSRMSVILGVTSAQELVVSMAARLQKPVWVKSLREHGLPEEEVQRICDRISGHYPDWDTNTFPGLLGNVVAGRIANRLGLGGTNCVLDAACGSSLAAVSMAVQELRLGSSDLVITGGVDTLNDIFMFMCFSKTPALSPTGDCRPFSDAADGTMLSEGLGMVALRRLEDARRDGDKVYAILKGVGTSSDGRAKSVYAPVPDGQARALRRAQEDAGIDPATVELIEAHGTGTKAGDAAEMEGLRMAFPAGGTDSDRNRCALGSVKSQIGHAKAAAGAAGLFKAVMALHHRVLPPTIKIDRPNPHLGLEDSAFHLNTSARPWIRGSDHPRRAGVSAFGFGGSNYHVLLEECTDPSLRAERLRTMPCELVVVGGRDRAEVRARAAELAARSREPGVSLAWIAWTSHRGFDATLPSRLALVAPDLDGLRTRLDEAIQRLDASSEGTFELPDGTVFGEGTPEGGVAFLFPGQGSQSLRMGADLAMRFDAALEPWDRSADLIPGLHGVAHPPRRFSEEETGRDETRLRETRWAQPAIGCASLATLSILRDLGLEPRAAAGHSYGELLALHCAGAFSRDDALLLSRRRGELMHAASAECAGSGMTAVQHDEDGIRQILGTRAGGVVLANMNAPAQTVISGTIGDLEEAERLLAAERIAFRRLPVAAAFHSPVVASCALPFRESLEPIAVAAPAFPVYSGESASPYESDPSAIRARLGRQIAEPVRFRAAVEAMHEAGIRVFVEVGSGSVLTQLVGQILSGRPHVAVPTDRKGRDGVESLLRALAKLSALGVPLRLESLWNGHAAPEPPASSGRPRMSIPIDGSNRGKPYPPAGGASELPPPNPPRPAVEPAPAARTEPPAEPPPRGWVEPPRHEVATGAPSSPWLDAWMEAQRQTAETHAHAQRAMAESHAAYLQATEASLAMLASMASGAVPASRPAPVRAPEPAIASIAEPPRRPTPPAVTETVPMEAPVAPAPATAPSTTPPASDTGTASIDLARLMVEVVAEKTGYPVSMVDPAMDLEADLGVDSIKRVEILAAVQERAPGLPPVDPSRLGALRTLSDIVAALGATATAAAPTEEAAPTPGDAAAPSGIERFRVELVDAPLGGFSRLPLDRNCDVAVTGEGTGIAEALVEELGRRGISARVVDEPSSDDSCVVFLGGLRPAPAFDDAKRTLLEAFRAARAIAPRLSAADGLFAVVQDTGGRLGVDGASPERAVLGGLAALAKTAALEWPGSTVCSIDLCRTGRDARAMAVLLADELLAGAGEVEVGIGSDGIRRTLRAVPSAGPAAPDIGDPGPGDVVVVSGGARGVTASCVVEWARRSRARFLLLGRSKLVDEPERCRGIQGEASLKRLLLEEASLAGRTPTPRELAQQTESVLAGREIRATLEALERAGSPARYAAVDVQDAAALAETLDRTRAEWGPVTALVHAAGILADKRIAELDEPAFERVLATKVDGLRALLEATAADPLATVCVFSSIAARCGNVGQAAYAVANECLNKMAWSEARRRGSDVVVKAIGWGPWEGGMVNPALRRHFGKLGVPMIPLEDGARRFADEMRRRDGAVEIVVAGGVGPDAFSGPDSSRTVASRMRVHRDTHPYLADHAIDGTPVLPMMLVLEWFARAARSFRPDLHLASLRDVRVLRAVRLERFDSAGDTFEVRCGGDGRSGERALVSLELVGADGTRHYAGSAELAPTPPDGPEVFDAGPLVAWNDAPLYGDVLFHGPAFQAIESVAGMGADGISGTVRTTPIPSTSRESWLTDMIGLDCGMQFSLLWIREHLGGSALPMAMGEFRFVAPPPGPGCLRSQIRCRTRNRSVVVADATLYDERDVPVASLKGVELVLRPDQRRDSTP